MSPDEIFAAHMWPWPDPLLKRDSAGRIIFINAAFLKMYGGRVEDWRGNTVGGWPAPQNTGVPFRFETRIAGADGEQVYDWIEYILSDGCGLALARDVTALLTQNTPPPGNIMVPDAPAENTAYEPAGNDAAMGQAPLAAHAAQTIPAATMETTAPAGDWDTEIALSSVPDIAPEPEYAPQTAATEDVPAYNPPVEALAPDAESVAMHETPAVPAEPYVQVEPTVRDHERRALPIENGDAVLGNNWRDAVIAKAVGADIKPEAAAADSPTDAPQTLRKPIQSEAAVDTPQMPSTAPSGSKTKSDLRILLAEDNAINALLTRTLLEAEGCSVDVVEDGALAVEAVKNAQYDMIFMDMRMPNMDGLESTRKIRALPNVPSQMPIVALTANAFDDDRNACFDSGMNDFMTKPVSAEELSQMVETWALKSEEQRLAS